MSTMSSNDSQVPSSDATTGNDDKMSSAPTTGQDAPPMSGDVISQQTNGAPANSKTEEEGSQKASEEASLTDSLLAGAISLEDVTSNEQVPVLSPEKRTDNQEAMDMSDDEDISHNKTVAANKSNDGWESSTLPSYNVLQTPPSMSMEEAVAEEKTLAALTPSQLVANQLQKVGISSHPAIPATAVAMMLSPADLNIVQMDGNETGGSSEQKESGPSTSQQGASGSTAPSLPGSTSNPLSVDSDEEVEYLTQSDKSRLQLCFLPLADWSRIVGEPPETAAKKVIDTWLANCLARVKMRKNPHPWKDWVGRRKDAAARFLIDHEKDIGKTRALSDWELWFFYCLKHLTPPPKDERKAKATANAEDIKNLLGVLNHWPVVPPAYLAERELYRKSPRSMQHPAAEGGTLYTSKPIPKVGRSKSSSPSPSRLSQYKEKRKRERKSSKDRVSISSVEDLEEGGKIKLWIGECWPIHPERQRNLN